jgi:cytidine deaminase
MINQETIDTMVRMAREYMHHAYTPQTNMAVGACVLAADGTLYGGCNIENTVPSLSCCAETFTMHKAIADAKREFDALAVIADTEDPFVPCGACLQLMAEFGVQDVILANLKGDVRVRPLDAIVPCAKAMLSNHAVERDEQEEIERNLSDDEEV